MELSITIDTSLAQKLAKTPADIDRGIKAGITRVIRNLEQATIREAARIYAEPIPTRAQVNEYNAIRKKDKRRTKWHGDIGGQGKPAWVRTGSLIAGLRWQVISPTEAAIVMTGPAAEYAYRNDLTGGGRHGLGVNWTPKKPALGIIRRNPFFMDADRKTAPQVQKLFEDGLRKELGL